MKERKKKKREEKDFPQLPFKLYETLNHAAKLEVTSLLGALRFSPFLAIICSVMQTTVFLVSFSWEYSLKVWTNPLDRFHVCSKLICM